MIPRYLASFGAAVTLMVTALPLPTLIGAGQAPAQGPQTVWSGTVRDVKAYGTVDSSGNPSAYAHYVSVNFRYVQENDANGTRFTSRRVSWQADGRSQSAAQLHECRGSGSLELGPSSSVDAVTSEQARALQIPCTSRDFMSHFTFIEQPPERISVPRIVDWEKLREGCSYSEERGSERYTVSVAPEIDAVIELDTRPGGDYAGLVPSPGQRLVLTVTTRPAMPAYFKFVLEPNEVSRFPGYASNANVDAAFFVRAKLTDLQDAYPNDGPDLLFAPRDYTDRSLWRTADFATAETGRPEADATVTITAMDYGAIGRLRAFVKGSACGSWQPVRVRVSGQDRDYVTIPMDEDHNLIADSLEEYRGDPGRDDDGEPVGERTPGDGLTAFEEYRGFLTAGGDCADRSQDFHLRSDPGRKDLFVHSPDPELSAILPAFAWASDLNVHAICEPHYGNNVSAGALNLGPTDHVVNFTLQRANQRTWFGRTISQETPQRGLYLIDDALTGLAGISCTNGVPCGQETDETVRFGSPRYTRVAKVDKQKLVVIEELLHTTVHELGHSVGMPHHANEVAARRLVPPGAGNYKRIVLAPGSSCADPRSGAASEVDLPVYLDGVFKGCYAFSIAGRNATHSGDANCPMKYTAADYYVAPGSRLLPEATVSFNQYDNPPLTFPAESALRTAPSFSGRVLKYRSDQDPIGLGKFCELKTGTGLNGLPGDANHAGDATGGNCRFRVVVNDVRP